MKKEDRKTEQLNHIWNMINVAENQGFVGKFDYSIAGKKSLFINNLLKVAAVLVLLAGTGMLGYHLLNHPADKNVDILTTTGEKTFKVLDDGTRIWLNKNSSINYNKSFGQHKREIILEGEAYFDVVKNEDIPLLIHVGNIDIEVKGTAFNVNAYKNSKKIQVALVRGLIQITDKLDSKQKILLHPNERLIFNTARDSTQHKFLVSSIKSETLLNETKWIADTLIFSKERLSDLVMRMEKKYDLRIEIHSEKLKDKRFSGRFANETIQQALEALKLSYPLTYTINNRLVVIKD
ncbi:FecR family protein [Pedobacter steynii]|uniref:Ferric-dicitrate binding protein FerR, regulates iron transport through sigma-19 n=1 Tax=Pedobacter steynii TaxID=430522 RepID=A0A1D7QEH5_9SPHI|nr:FecR domain-containing protein [Pedobacter steynii]AOM77098.1 hypothetical protein BFS30_07920 [Pedobacter steynii]